MDRRGCTVPAQDLRLPLIERYHNVGHYGKDYVMRLLNSNKIWWPGMRVDIDRVIGDCTACISHNVQRDGFHPAQSVHSAIPGAHWQFDLAHMPKTQDGKEWLLVVIDVFTGFTVLRVLDHHDTAEIAKKLFEIFSLLGPPNILQCDNDELFTAAICQTLCLKFGVDQRFITPYNAGANGKVEATIGKIKRLLAKDLRGADSLWPFRLCFAQMAYNTRIARLTGTSPFVLMFNRRFNLIHDLTRPDVVIEVDRTKKSWQRFQHEVTSLVYPAVELRAAGVQADYIKYLDKTRQHILTKALPAGTVVVLKDPRYLKGAHKPPLQARYLGNKFIVVERTSNGAYTLRGAADGVLLDRRVTLDQMKVVKGPRFNQEEDDDTIYLVQDILEHREGDKGVEYLVHWKGWPVTDATWEPKEHILDEEIVRRYFEKIGVNEKSARTKRNEKAKEKRKQQREKKQSANSKASSSSKKGRRR